MLDFIQKEISEIAPLHPLNYNNLEFNWAILFVTIFYFIGLYGFCAENGLTFRDTINAISKFFQNFRQRLLNSWKDLKIYSIIKDIFYFTILFICIFLLCSFLFILLFLDVVIAITAFGGFLYSFYKVISFFTNIE